MRIGEKIQMSGVKDLIRLDVSKLHDPNMRRTVIDELDIFDFDGTWDLFDEQVYSVSLESLGLQ